MRVLLVALVCVGGFAHANNDALLEACNAVPDATRRLECFKQAAAKPVQSPTAMPHQELRDALIALDGQLVQGMSLVSYNEAMLPPAREMALFEKRNPGANPQAIGALRAAMSAYSDAARFWKASISAGVRNRGIFTSSTMTYDDMTLYGISDLIGKYSFPTVGTGPFGAFTGVSQYAGVSTIWAVARKAHEEAFDILSGKGGAHGDEATLARATADCPQSVINRMRFEGKTESSIKSTCGKFSAAAPTALVESIAIPDDGNPAKPSRACDQETLDRLRAGGMTEANIKATCGTAL